MTKKTISGNKLSVTRGSAQTNMPTKTKRTKKTNQSNEVVKAFLNYNKKGITRVFVAGGSRSGLDDVYEEQAFELGYAIGKKKFRLDFGLSSKGIMGAVAKGVLKAFNEEEYHTGKPIHAVTTKEYLALYKNDAVIDSFSEIIVSHTLEERKQQLLGADFVIFAPGGVGTLDELAYDCVAMQDGFLNFKPFILFNTNGFFYHILEYLKEIQKKGFASNIPFIVVDDAFEACIAFDLIELYYKKEIKENPKKAKTALKKLIYLLPFVIEERNKNPEKTTQDLFKEMKKIMDYGTDEEKATLEKEVDMSYLNKEIERMYERLAKAGKDTAVVSDKLNFLRKQFKNKHLN